MPQLSFNSPLGPLTVFADDDAVVAIEWGRGTDGQSADETEEPATPPAPVLNEARRQIDAYFDGKLKVFDLPVRPHGTDFQQRVWRALQAIPYGQTQTYGEVAATVGSVARAVGGACGDNPIPIVIPCHRVLGANGKLTGFSASGGLDDKRRLLVLEGVLTAPLDGF